MEDEKMYVEQEIKFRVGDVSSIMKRLRSLGATYKGFAFQRTIRFENSGKLKENGLFLRVRSGFKDVITLKSKMKDASKEVYQREEIELELEDIEKMRSIINRLGYRDEMIMEKYRTTFDLEDVEITVDELPFGIYIEIEGKEDKIFEVVDRLELDKDEKIKVTYWDLFEDYKKKNNLESLGKDIVFPQDYVKKFDCKKI